MPSKCLRINAPPIGNFLKCEMSASGEHVLLVYDKTLTFVQLPAKVSVSYPIQYYHCRLTSLRLSGASTSNTKVARRLCSASKYQTTIFRSHSCKTPAICPIKSCQVQHQLQAGHRRRHVASQEWRHGLLPDQRPHFAPLLVHRSERGGQR